MGNPFKSPHELKVSEAVRRLNPHLFTAGPVEAKHRAQRAPTLERDLPPQQSRKISVVVCIIGFRQRVLDDDNFTAGCKPLRDAIAASIGLDDGDRRIRWEYHQIKSERAATAVKIDATIE